jgi:hypothetical protein
MEIIQISRSNASWTRKDNLLHSREKVMFRNDDICPHLCLPLMKVSVVPSLLVANAAAELVQARRLSVQQ